ncbi:MAG: hypothetical protein EOO39_17085, partial [Cytophagaceae bacterium]
AYGLCIQSDVPLLEAPRANPEDHLLCEDVNIRSGKCPPPPDGSTEQHFFDSHNCTTLLNWNRIGRFWICEGREIVVEPAQGVTNELLRAVLLGPVLAMLLFQQHFLNLRTESKPAFWATQILKYSFFALFIGLIICQLTGITETYTGANRLIRYLHTVMANCFVLVIIGNIVVGLRSTDAVKRLYAVGFGVQTAAQLVVASQNVISHQRESIFLVEPYLVLLVVFFIDLVVFSYLLAYRYRKSLDEQRRLQISLAQTQQQTNEAVIDLLESERQQVGTLILTDVGGRLTQTRSLLATLTPSPLLNEAVGLIDKTDDCLVHILSDGLPPDLAQKGLPVALADLVRQRSQAGSVQLAFTHENVATDKAAGLSTMQVRQLYRITNELINNAIKHANAQKCEIVFRQNYDGWQLSVADDGQGFDTTLTQKEAGIGLKNLAARAQTLGATVTTRSGKDGTIVCVEG